MLPFNYRPSVYRGNDILSERTGWYGFAGGVVIFFLCSFLSYCYFAHTSLKTFSLDGGVLYVIGFVLTSLEVVIYKYFKDKDKPLVLYEEGIFDSNSGCWLLISMLVGGFHLNCILFNELNGRLDFYKSTKVKARVSASIYKSSSIAGTYDHYYLRLEDLTNDGKQRQIEIEVPRSFYSKVSQGNNLEFETKPGLLGFEHISSEITVLK